MRITLLAGTLRTRLAETRQADSHHQPTRRVVVACTQRWSHRSATVERMKIQRMDHVGIVVDDLEAATAFFLELGLKLQGEGQVEGSWVDRVVGLEGVRW